MKTENRKYIDQAIIAALAVLLIGMGFGVVIAMALNKGCACVEISVPSYDMPEKYSIAPDFITPVQEEELLRRIYPLMPKRRKGHGGRNQILRYGSTIPYADNHASAEIPDWLMTFSGHITFDHVSVNEYYRGQEIPWHIDSPGSGEEIAVLSLLSGGVLEFRKGKERINIETPPRTLLRFSGPLRWDWEHRLWASQKRYSIVFRNSAV